MTIIDQIINGALKPDVISLLGVFCNHFKKVTLKYKQSNRKKHNPNECLKVQKIFGVVKH